MQTNNKDNSNLAVLDVAFAPRLLEFAKSI
jgi:hypothetical protein